MSVYKMNDAQVIKFLKLYRDAVCLWKINSEMYNDRAARNEALQKISDEMDIAGFGVQEVIQEIDSLTSAYQKLKLTRQVNRPAPSWFWSMHAFLGTQPRINEDADDIGDLEVQSDGPSEGNDSGDLENSIDVNSADQNELGEMFEQAFASFESEVERRPQVSSLTSMLLESETPDIQEWCKTLALYLNTIEPSRAENLKKKMDDLISGFNF